MAKSREIDAESPAAAENVGFCLGCGSRLSICGKPFTADLKCPKCLATNIYEDSFQPSRLREPFAGVKPS
jgi:hypothetical protein